MKKKVIIASVRMPLTHQFFHLGHREGKMLQKVRPKHGSGTALVLSAHHRKETEPWKPQVSLQCVRETLTH